MDVRYGFQVAPGQCFTCGNGDSSLTVIDTGEHPMTTKRFRIYICAPCVAAMAKLVAPVIGCELVANETLAELRASVERVVALEARRDEAEATLARLAAFARSDA